MYCDKDVPLLLDCHFSISHAPRGTQALQETALQRESTIERLAPIREECKTLRQTRDDLEDLIASFREQEAKYEAELASLRQRDLRRQTEMFEFCDREKGIS